MKLKKLIEQLQAFDEDAEVMIFAAWPYNPIGAVDHLEKAHDRKMYGKRLLRNDEVDFEFADIELDKRPKPRDVVYIYEGLERNNR